MLQIFEGNSWKPVAATGYYHYLQYPLFVRVCKHLGYGPLVGFFLRNITVNDSTPVELHCHGNETSLHECSIKQLNPPFNNISLLGVYCRGKAWGNIRFVSSRDFDVSMEPSILEHVEFSQCGNRHGRKVYAVEAVINVPEVNFITVKNCIGGGLGVYFTKNPLHVKNSEFTMLSGSGIYFFPSGQNIEVGDTKFINNLKGISIVKSDNIPRVYYGRMFLCDEENNLVQNKTILYFEVPFMTMYPTLVTCEKVLNLHYGQGIKITLLHFKGTQRVKIYGFFAGYLILDRSSTHLSHLLHKDLFVPCDSISIHWTGHSNSQVVFKVEEIDIIDLPCTFDLGLCTWHTFSNMSVDGHNVTTTWKILAEHSWQLNWGDDYSYLSPNGKRLSLTSNDHLDAHAAIISPVITKHSPFCSLVFFYQQGNESALLSTYIQTGTYPEVKQELIWRGKQGEKERTWVKVQIALPADLDEYRVLLHGKVNKSLYNHSVNYLSIDNLELLGCSKRDHRISNSVFRGHFPIAITYISKAFQSRQNSISIERCKIVNSYVAIFIDIRDSDFTLAHNLISGNYRLSFAATLRVSQGTVSSKGLIYRNTITGNNNGIMVKQEERSKGDPAFLYILENAFENNNYYYHWSQFQGRLLKLFNIPCWIKNNVFFNNSNFIVIESTFQGPFFKGQQCEMNTFYLNRGLGQSFGSCTVLSDGQMSYHWNNFKNPAFLYEFCATNATDKIHAEMNWWGVDQESELALRILDREDFDYLSTVIYKPFQKLPPKEILSRGCPPGWMNQDSICAVLRGGGETFKEARDYCEYYGGHIASTTDAADLKIVYARMEPSSIYGSPAVPIWVTNGEASQGDVDNREQQCTVIAQNGTQTIVPCNGLHPFICIRKAESSTSDPVASTTNPSSDVASSTNSSSDVPMSLQPQTSKWYTKPPVLIAMSLGFVVLLALLVILFIAKNKGQTHPKQNDKTQESWDNEALEMDTVL
ncbi:protein bark beetle-like isoform X1 [Montipora capricornis]|uniref:protein bark beetle-like isoform X1 n=1 Tax=Montipora capricornis TaxID=246305 RepID=UPI0035F123D5